MLSVGLKERMTVDYSQNVWKKPKQKLPGESNRQAGLALFTAGALFASAKANASSSNAVVEQLMNVVKPIFDKVFGQMMDGLTSSMNKSESEVSVAIAKSTDAAIEVRKLIHNNELRDHTRVTTDYCLDEEVGKPMRDAVKVRNGRLADLHRSSSSETAAKFGGFLNFRTPVQREISNRVLTEVNGNLILDFDRSLSPDKLRTDMNKTDISSAKFIADTVFVTAKLEQEQLVQEQVESGDLRAKEQLQRNLGSNARMNVFNSAFYSQIADHEVGEGGASVNALFKRRLDETYYNPEYFADLSNQNAQTPVFGAVLRETTFNNALALKRLELNIQRTTMLYSLLADEMSVIGARSATKYASIINRK